MNEQSNDTFIDEQLVDNISIYDVDEAFFNWWKEVLKVQLTNPKGQKEEIPVVFVAPERWELARREGMRDGNGTLIAPIIAISRAGMTTSNDLPTSRHFADTKQQVIYHQEVDPKTSLVQELKRKQFQLNDKFATFSAARPIYQIYSRRAPDHYSIKYEVKIWTPYIQHMNEFIQKVAQKYDFLSVKSFKFNTKGKYYLVAFQEDEISDEGNSDDYSGTERIIKKTISFNVGAYIHPENDDQKPNFRKYYSQSKFVLRVKVLPKMEIFDTIPTMPVADDADGILDEQNSQAILSEDGKVIILENGN